MDKAKGGRFKGRRRGWVEQGEVRLGASGGNCT